MSEGWLPNNRGPLRTNALVTWTIGRNVRRNARGGPSSPV